MRSAGRCTDGRVAEELSLSNQAWRCVVSGRSHLRRFAAVHRPQPQYATAVTDTKGCALENSARLFNQPAILLICARENPERALSISLEQVFHNGCRDSSHFFPCKLFRPCWYTERSYRQIFLINSRSESDDAGALGRDRGSAIIAFSRLGAEIRRAGPTSPDLSVNSAE